VAGAPVAEMSSVAAGVPAAARVPAVMGVPPGAEVTAGLMVAVMIPGVRGSAIVGGSVLAAAGWAVPALAPVVAPVAARLDVPRRFDSRDSVALTFDDGPHPEGTLAVLALLAAAEVKATFFMVGERVLQAPRLAAEVAAQGHTIAVHGHRHRNLLRLSRTAIAADLDTANDVIGEHTGVAPVLHRPPYGIYSWPALREVRRRGWAPVLWSRWGHDWRRRATPQGIARELTQGLEAGDILLLHDADDYSAPDSWRRTVAALPLVLEAIAAAGLKVELYGR
jgi:peptidoglycan/xylan/chitin deacetylase (PgdA/CDA1 family)